MTIRKTVGKEKDEHPLDRAYRLMKNLEQLRGFRPEDNYAPIRKTVGKIRSAQD